MYYRSDWPELGLNGPLSEDTSSAAPEAWHVAGSNEWRWISKLDDFESRLYGIPIWNLSLEIRDSGNGWLATGLNGSQLAPRLPDMLHQFLQRAPWTDAYVAAKVVREEPLFEVLIDAGFEQVEHRCLYESRIGDLQAAQCGPDESIQYRSLASIDTKLREGVREEILALCNEDMRQGHSRHFTDDFLLQRLPGSAYILNVMKLNFEHVPMDLTLLAHDTDSDRYCGFSILAERPGLGRSYYTQLLSGVAKAYRGRGVYAGLTRLLTEVLPGEARLINVTHAKNESMRRAYEKSGRRNHADTLVLRRIFGSATG